MNKKKYTLKKSSLHSNEYQYDIALLALGSPLLLNKNA
jgi:hypothetical protein